MEVEVKLRLPNAEAYSDVASILSDFHVKTHLQENLFFDGASGELSSKRAVLRLRFYNNDARCVVSLKGKAVIVNGVSTVEEDEEDLDPGVGRACVADPRKLGEVDLRVLRRAKEEFGVGNSGFVCLGGFGNVRNVYEWNGLTLELDETSFKFGTLYEIECESTEPEAAKKLLEELLNEHEISYSYSEKSKFAIFRSGELP
uniref:CYTH domain-containing protein n=1 Tax=Kalanchoe fedtschenkoi TaxID=63787 RepID=A0A7N0UIF0_KALFE